MEFILNTALYSTARATSPFKGRRGEEEWGRGAEEGGEDGEGGGDEEISGGGEGKTEVGEN